MIKNKLVKNAKQIDKFLINYLSKQKKSLLIYPMKYGVISGGKKIRSTVIFSAGKLFKLDKKKLINICAAVECIHSYSLIHDDLPCMDDDSMRRGKPSVHIKFGEASAVLAGNSLLTLAFEIITDKKYKIKSSIKVIILKKLAECAGHTGIAGGQFLDLDYENKKVQASKIISMQKKKTGKLFEFCCLAPAILSGASKKTKKDMSFIGKEIGFLFQISDDLLDITGNKISVGKPVHSDKKKGKSTLIRLLGYNKTLKFALRTKKTIMNKLNKYGSRSGRLAKIANFVLDRSY